MQVHLIIQQSVPMHASQSNVAQTVFPVAMHPAAQQVASAKEQSGTWEADRSLGGNKKCRLKKRPASSRDNLVRRVIVMVSGVRRYTEKVHGKVINVNT